jgi:hypothetical protein
MSTVLEGTASRLTRTGSSACRYCFHNQPRFQG